MFFVPQQSNNVRWGFITNVPHIFRFILRPLPLEHQPSRFSKPTEHVSVVRHPPWAAEGRGRGSRCQGSPAPWWGSISGGGSSSQQKPRVDSSRRHVGHQRNSVRVQLRAALRRERSEAVDAGELVSPWALPSTFSPSSKSDIYPTSRLEDVPVAVIRSELLSEWACFRKMVFVGGFYAV